MSEVTLPNEDDFVLLGTPKLNVPAYVNRSKFTGRRKVIGGTGAEVWTATAMIGPIATEEEERQWRAFLFALDGPANWFKAPLPCNAHAGSKPLVNSASSTGYTLPLDGMPNSTTILKAGQWMTVPLPSGRKRAVCLTADLVTNGSGQATASFRPALTEIPANNAEVETKAPYLPVSLTGVPVGLDGDGAINSAQINLEEAI